MKSKGMAELERPHWETCNARCRFRSTLAARPHLDPHLNVECTASGNRPHNRIAQICAVLV